MNTSIRYFSIIIFAIFLLIPRAFAYDYLSDYHGSSVSYGRSSSGSYRSTWKGSSSGYIGYSSSSGSYFGVPSGSSVAGLVTYSRKHRQQYRNELQRIKAEQKKLNNLPPPCGIYGRAPKNCPVTSRYPFQ